MSHLADLPVWAAALVAALLLFAAGLTLIGAWGLYILPSFYERIHAPSLGATWGAAGVVLASMLTFSLLGTHPVAHEALIGVFVTVTTPATMMLLGRASLYRDRTSGAPDVPGRLRETDPDRDLSDARSRADDGGSPVRE